MYRFNGGKAVPRNIMLLKNAWETADSELPSPEQQFKKAQAKAKQRIRDIEEEMCEIPAS